MPKEKINVHCKFDEMVQLIKLVDHPRNNNKHPQNQIDHLARLYEAHGIRNPIIVSKRSGYIVSGHGRKLAGIRAGLDEFPVVFQDFENEAREYAFMISDNAISLQAEFDLSLVHQTLKDLEPFDIDELGIHNFNFEPVEIKDAEIDLDDLTKTLNQICPKCGFEFESK